MAKYERSVVDEKEKNDSMNIAIESIIRKLYKKPRVYTCVYQSKSSIEKLYPKNPSCLPMVVKETKKGE